MVRVHPPRRRHAQHLVLVVTLWALALSWALWRVQQAASQPSLSVVCSSIEDLCLEWARDFTEVTGTPVRMVRMSTGEALARVEQRPHEFDVWHGGSSEAFEAARQRSLLSPYPSPGAAEIPAEYRDRGGAWTGVYRGILGFCSHREALARLGLQPPDDWDDLRDARLARQVSLPNPLTSGTGYTMVWTQRQRLHSQTGAVEWFSGLAPNVLQYTNSGTAPASIVARGEAVVALTFTQHCLKAALRNRSDLAITYPRSGTGFEVGAVAILRGARHLEGARSYIDYAVSRRAQQLGDATSSRQLPTRLDAEVPAALRVPADITMVNAQVGPAARERGSLTELFLRRVRP